MRNHIKLLLASFVLMLPFSVVNGDAGNCCVAGTYDGLHEDVSSRSCASPKTEKFTMEITQIHCGGKISGTVTSADGHVSAVRGKVVSSGAMCVIQGQASEDFSDPAREVISFKGTLTQNRRTEKWQVTDGIYNNSNGCRGIFQMGLR